MARTSRKPGETRGRKAVWSTPNDMVQLRLPRGILRDMHVVARLLDSGKITVEQIQALIKD
jgi:hypothetical protein